MTTNVPNGIYESLITELFEKKLQKLEDAYYIDKKPLDSAEAANYLTRFLSHILSISFDMIPHGEDRLSKQIDLANKLVTWLASYLNKVELSENLIHSQGEILTALFAKENPLAADLKSYVGKITPHTGLAQSELFTGSNVGISLDSEIRKEILSADEICWLVSFIKWTGIRIFEDVLREATSMGKKIRIITTSYMGATDQKAVDFLASLPNTSVRLSYITDRERLHAKAYLFLRNSGFHTGYIGSSNISRSALTNGLEWNLKITTQEIPHIIEKFKSTFETYWESPDFEPYDPNNATHSERLKVALRKEHPSLLHETPLFFDLKPHPYQKEILERLQAERTVHNRMRNLVVAATGTGKTIISAFDFQQIYKQNPQTTFLFVAHRQEILKQAQSTYRGVLRIHDFGELWVENYEPEKYNQLFASVQTLNNRLKTLNLSEDYYDYIVIDEVHHIAASSYQSILQQFSPKILLGLTATPERHDGTDIREDFCNTIAAELRLPEAINHGHLAPFQYFGIDDPTDLSNVQWVKGRYLPSELTSVYMANDQRVLHILRSMKDILDDIHAIKALAFCVSQEHATFMCKKFLLKNIKAAVLTSNNTHERATLRNRLCSGEINILFVVDIFNEGVDIPEVDTVLFLRPTESLTVFLQQLGRGLRLSTDKQCLTVLDFVGNAHREYDFSQKFRALVGKSHTSISDEITNDFPHLPLGCSIVLQKQAKEVILRNIKQAIINQKKIISCIKGFSEQTDMPLTLKNFLYQNEHISLDDIYKIKINPGGGWSRLCIKAGALERAIDVRVEQAMYRGISKRVLQSTSPSYLNFILRLMKSHGSWDYENARENQFALMVHYDFWQKAGKELGFSSLKESLRVLVEDDSLRQECIESVETMLDQLDVQEIPMQLAYPSVLNIHARYSRDEILAAFGENRFEKKSSSREGVVEIKSLNTELLFVTLQKTEKKFSPTTLYHDYAINEHLFHWQTQNTARPDRGRGKSYVDQPKTGKQILLFVREQISDEFGRAMGFINLGPVHLNSYSGSQPMDIVWTLEHPLPPWLWQQAAKLAVG